MLCTNRVEPRLDVLHIVDIFHRALFAGGNDQALLAVHERNLRDFLNRHKAEIVFRLRADVDKRSQAIVLAEVAARIFVARRAVLDFAYSVEADESSLLTITPQTQGLLRGANRTGLPTVLVHNDLRLLARGTEAVADKVHFRLHNCQIVLRASLQYKTGSESCKVGTAGNVEEDILRQH